MIVVGGESGNGLLDDVQVSEHLLFKEWEIVALKMSSTINMNELCGPWLLGFLEQNVILIIITFFCQVLNFDSFSWATASSKLYLSPSSLPLKIPACKGHSLVP